MAAPYASAYVASKHAVRGLGMSLRQERALEGAKGIHVCTVRPGTIDTPFQHSANYTGRAVKAMPPVYPSERVARTIVNCARRPRREVFVGNMARLSHQQSKLAPGPTELGMALMVDKHHLYQDRPSPPTRGAVHQAMLEGAKVGGGWHGKGKTRTRRLASAGVAALVSVASFSDSGGRTALVRLRASGQQEETGGGGRARGSPRRGRGCLGNHRRDPEWRARPDTFRSDGVENLTYTRRRS